MKDIELNLTGLELSLSIIILLFIQERNTKKRKRVYQKKTLHIFIRVLHYKILFVRCVGMKYGTNYEGGGKVSHNCVLLCELFVRLQSNIDR